MTREELDSKKKLILEFAASKTYRPMTVKEMGVVLQVPSKQKKDLRKVVEELSGEGKLQVNSKGRIKLMPDNIKTGKYMVLLSSSSLVISIPPPFSIFSLYIKPRLIYKCHKAAIWLAFCLLAHCL